MQQDLQINIHTISGNQFIYNSQDTQDTIQTMINKVLPNRYQYSIYIENESEELLHTKLLSTLTPPYTLFGIETEVTEAIFDNYENLYDIIKKNNAFQNTFESLFNASHIRICNDNIETPVDINPIRYLSNITTLYLYQINLINLECISYITNLEELTLGHCSNCEDISCLTNIKNLYIINSKITNLISNNELPKMKSLIILDMDSIEYISAVGQMKNLYKLNIHSCPNIRDISPLQYCVDLIYIILKDMPLITDISVLEKTNKVEILFIHNIAISNLLCLKELSELETLHIRKLQISNIDSINNLDKLREVYIHDCSCIKKLPSKISFIKSNIY